jgi:phospholipid/cholesterol/gamma-HCH transport system permease protein
VVVVGVNAGGFLASFFTQGTVVDVVGGEVKCVIFGAIVAAVCIGRGIGARGGAEGVAKAVHSAVIWSFVGLLAFEYLFTPTVLALFHDQLTLR